MMPIHTDSTTTTFSSLTAAYLTSTPPVPAAPWSPPPPSPTSPQPSISSLEDWAAVIEHSSVYRSTLPIGFWINGITFLIKQDGAEQGGGGRKGGAGVWVCEWKAEDPAVTEPAQGLLEDVMTVWQFGEREGLGEGGRVGGWTEEKPMPTDGMEGGELIDLLSVFSSEDQRQTEALVFIM